MLNSFKANIWKLYLIGILHRRNYYPIVAIFFLMLPGTLEHQIGIYSIAGYIAGFLLEIPSGYLSDKLGHKNAVIAGLFFLMLTSVFFAIASSLIYFVLASICLTAGFSFLSGSRDAFLHETLAELKQEKNFTKVMSHIAAFGSLISIFLILLVPLTTKINIRLPFIIFIVTDLISLITALTLKSPKIKFESSKKKNFMHVLKDVNKSGLIYLSIFEGLIFGTMFASGNYTTVHLNNLGLPLALIGITMALSRFIWFAMSTIFAKVSDKISLKHILVADILYYIPFFFILYFLENLYIAIIIVAFAGGYKFSRMLLIRGHIVNDYIKDKRYKATILSIHAQISSLLQIVLIIVSSIIVMKSIELVYITFSILLAILLPILLIKVVKKTGQI